MSSKTPGRGAGFYNQPGIIQQNTPADNTQGEPVPNWVTVASDWFCVAPMAGRDIKKFEQLQAQITHIVTCRYSSNTSGIKPTEYRILLLGGTQILNVAAAWNIEARNVEMELHCVEVALRAAGDP